MKWFRKHRPDTDAAPPPNAASPSTGAPPPDAQASPFDATARPESFGGVGGSGSGLGGQPSADVVGAFEGAPDDALEAGAVLGAEPGDRVDRSIAGDPLLALLVSAVEYHGYECRVLSGDQVEISREGRDSPLQMWLTNLRQWVAREPRGEWEAIVSDFVGSLIATTEVDEEDVLDLEDYGLIRPLLRTRLYADDFQVGPGEIVRRPVAPGLIEILVIDRPTSLMLVRADMASAWQVSADEAFRAAYDNVRLDGPLEIESELFDGVRLSTLHGETAYVTAHAVWVGDYPVTGPEGVLVTVPVQGVIHAAPIRGMDVLNAMDLLIKIAWSGYQEGPRSVSPNVYWWQEDTPLLLAGAVEPGEDSLSVKITPEFQDLLERLAQD